MFYGNQGIAAYPSRPCIAHRAVLGAAQPVSGAALLTLWGGTACLRSCLCDTLGRHCLFWELLFGRQSARRQGVTGGLCLWESVLVFSSFFTLVRLSDASSSRQILLFSCFLCVLSFFFLSFLSFLSFFLSFFRSFFRSFFLSFVISFFFSFFLSFFLFFFFSFFLSLSFSFFFSLGRNWAPGFPFPVFLQGGHACEPDLAFASATRRASRALPIFPRASGSSLSAACWRSSRRRLLRAFVFSSSLFLLACRGAASASWMHSRQDSFFRRPSLCFFFFLCPFFFGAFLCCPRRLRCLHGGALTICVFFFLCVSSRFIGLDRGCIQAGMHWLQEDPCLKLREPGVDSLLRDFQGLCLG